MNVGSLRAIAALFLLGNSLSGQTAPAGLTDAQMKTLHRDKLLIAGPDFKQVFTPYLDSPMPVFITSDSLLAGYHVLFEESILRLELANTQRLPLVLRGIWQHLDEVEQRLTADAAITKTAHVRARMMIAVALALIGETDIALDPSMSLLAKEEVARIMAANAVEKPEWLGPPDPDFLAIDYSRFKPRGFYAGSDELERYFRAVSWLQAVPFRIEKNEELLVVVWLYNALWDFSNEGDNRKLDENLFDVWRDFLGRNCDPALGDFKQIYDRRFQFDSKQFASLKRDLLKETKEEEVSDRIRFDPHRRPSFHIVAARKTPDAVLFQEIMDRLNVHPEGLDLCAALGGKWAQSQIEKTGSNARLRVIQNTAARFSGEDLFRKYLHAISALIEPQSADAPAFMRRDLWQIKSCQTALGGWAQLRHTWALHAKSSYLLLFDSPEPPSGFVEPVPNFYLRMGDLIESSWTRLRRTGALDENDRALDFELRKLLRELKTSGVLEDPSRFEAIPHDVRIKLRSFRKAFGFPSEDGGSSEFFQRVAAKLEEVIAECEAGNPAAELQAFTRFEMRLDLGTRWQSLANLCRKLESLAHRQLRHVPFEKADEEFFKRYGSDLANIMFYTANAAESPRDDAPRIVDVVADFKTRQFLEVGTARPRAIYVLYPFEKKEVLCRGAVVPYCEFWNSNRLNDDEWKTMLDSERAPHSPDWAAPFNRRSD